MLPKDKENKRHEIVRAAARLFREKGYERATTRDLSGAVDLQAGSLFHHFSTKEDILCAVVEDVVSGNIQRMQQALHSLTCPRARLRALIRVELDAILGDNRDAMFVSVFEWRKMSQTKQDELIYLRDEYEGIWHQVLAEVEAEGLLHLDAQLLRRFLKGALSWTITWFKPEGSLNLEDLADHALAMVLPQIQGAGLTPVS